MRIVMALGLGIGAAASCTMAEHPDGPSPPPMAVGLTRAEVAERLTEALCFRDERCGNIGPEAEFPDEASCMAARLDETLDDLNADRCEDGVNRTSLEGCVVEIRHFDCDRTMGKFHRSEECHEWRLCTNELMPF